MYIYICTFQVSHSNSGFKNELSNYKVNMSFTWKDSEIAENSKWF